MVPTRSILDMAHFTKGREDSVVGGRANGDKAPCFKEERDDSSLYYLPLHNHGQPASFHFKQKLQQVEVNKDLYIS